MPKQSISKLIIFAAVVGAVFLLIIIKQRHPIVIQDIPKYDHTAKPSPAPVAPSPTPVSPKPSTPTPATPSPTPTAANVLLPVPFTPQAPTGNWDTIHNEDCEEASAIMANAYFNGPNDTKLATDYVEGQLTKLTDWEMETFGYNLDINSEETVKMIEANYNLHAKLVTSYTEEDIKNELSQKHLILFAANGQMLGNPNYKQPGPKYHMLVLRGYTSSSIITNDPGTRNGQNYSYSFDTLSKANGNWDHATEKVDLSKKNIIIVWK